MRLYLFIYSLYTQYLTNKQNKKISFKILKIHYNILPCMHECMHACMHSYINRELDQSRLHKLKYLKDYELINALHDSFGRNLYFLAHCPFKNERFEYNYERMSFGLWIIWNTMKMIIWQKKITKLIKWVYRDKGLRISKVYYLNRWLNYYTKKMIRILFL